VPYCAVDWNFCEGLNILYHHFARNFRSVKKLFRSQFFQGLWNETKRKKRKNFWNETERKENDKVVKRNGTKLNSCETETERNFCVTIKTKRKEKRITSILFKFRERFSFQLLIFNRKIYFLIMLLHPSSLLNFVVVFYYYTQKISAIPKKISKITKLA
jgi:hypothetical protein